MSKQDPRLPDGCRDSDIPGNHPDDTFMDAWVSEHTEECLDEFMADPDNQELIRDVVERTKSFDGFIEKKAQAAIEEHRDAVQSKGYDG